MSQKHGCFVLWRKGPGESCAVFLLILPLDRQETREYVNFGVFTASLTLEKKSGPSKLEALYNALFIHVN